MNVYVLSHWNGHDEYDNGVISVFPTIEDGVRYMTGFMAMEGMQPMRLVTNTPTEKSWNGSYWGYVLKEYWVREDFTAEYLALLARNERHD